MMIQSLGSNNIFNNCKNEERDKLGLDNTESNLKFDKFKKKTFNTIYAGSDYSTKNSSKDGLDYTFLSHRSQISTDKLKNTSKDYIYDLTNTWLLNLELINNLLKAYTLKSPDFTAVLAQISKLKKLFEKKSETRNKLVNKRGKILIDKQITEEFRRKIEENSELYREQIRETEENVDNKEEYIKIFEKKLKEVEIYVQKHTKNLVNSKFEVYKNFKMNDFINENTDLLRKKEQYSVEANQLLGQLEEIKQENYRFSHPQANKFNNDYVNYNNNFNFNKDMNNSINNYNINNNLEVSFKNTNVFGKNNNSNNNKVEENERKKSLNTSAVNINTENNKRNSIKTKYENSRVGEIMKQYNNQIKMIESKNKLLRASLNNFKSKCFNHNILKNYIEKIKREQRLKQNGELTYELFNQPSVIQPNDNNLTYIEKSNINMDLTRKLNTFMDFSVVLNKRDETNYNDLLANKTTDLFGNPEKQIWDVSCIEKN